MTLSEGNMHTNPFKQRTEKINVITLGCSKNLVDSEVLLSQLHASGIEAVHEESNSNAKRVIINTCGFIDQAKEESIQTILDYTEKKIAGDIEQVIVTGCLSQRYAEELREEIPEVDAYFGTQDLPDLLAAVGANYKHELMGERQPVTDAHYAYLKIAEGCNRPCSFCAIPLMRGKHRSRSIEELVKEAHFLVQKGVKELMLIAQDLTYYGIDKYGERKLDELLLRLSDVEGLKWIRLHYAYPSGFPLNVLPVIRERDNICRYLDIPLQHIADPVLKAMRRGINRRRTEELIYKIREEVPGIAIRTTLLVGHPGETEEAHTQLMEFVEKMQFERLGVFTYSHEEGTYAGNTFEDTIPEEIKQQRHDDIMDIQQDISMVHNRTRIQLQLPVLIDRKESGHYVGRTEYDSPEVDNEVIVHGANLKIGEFYEVQITDALEYDLIGHVV